MMLMIFLHVFVSINQTEWSTTPACPSFIAIVQKGSTEKNTMFRFVLCDSCLLLYLLSAYYTVSV